MHELRAWHSRSVFSVVRRGRTAISEARGPAWRSVRTVIGCIRCRQEDRMRVMRIMANLRVADVDAAKSFCTGYLGLSAEESTWDAWSATPLPAPGPESRSQRGTQPPPKTRSFPRQQPHPGPQAIIARLHWHARSTEFPQESGPGIGAASRTGHCAASAASAGPAGASSALGLQARWRWLPVSEYLDVVDGHLECAGLVRRQPGEPHQHITTPCRLRAQLDHVADAAGACHQRQAG
jgi:hypothetical protein